MNMKYEYILSPTAASMMYNHIRFLSNVNISAAHKLRMNLYHAFESLETMPHRCPIYSVHRAADTYRRLIVGRYQIIYAIDEIRHIVYIKYILDSRQDNGVRLP